MGKCPNCDSWNTLVETLVSPVVQTSNIQNLNINLGGDLLKLSEVKAIEVKRSMTGFLEFDRVLGGGIVPGEMVLIAGEPGIGKSTLLLQTAIKIAASSAKKSVLYVTGEESPQQVKIRADRIGKLPDNLYVFAQTDVDAVVFASEKVKPSLVIVDSIQTITTSRLNGSAGSIGQVRECAQVLQRHAKRTQTPIFVVGHVTKEGSVAGPKVLEHIVDAVLNLEGDSLYAFRLLRSVKNRFGSTFEVGVFEMTDLGMEEVTNPSKIFLSERVAKRPGSIVTSTIAGGRPILAEIQALSTPTMFGLPTRRVTGLDFNRMQVVLAALSRAAKIPIGSMDIYLNVAGGLKVNEPAVDLAAALAIASAVFDKPISEKACAFGEVGLLGELRPVSNVKNRISEARRMGFFEIISSEKYRTLEEAISHAITK